MEQTLEYSRLQGQESRQPQEYHAFTARSVVWLLLRAQDVKFRITKPIFLLFFFLPIMRFIVALRSAQSILAEGQECAGANVGKTIDLEPF